MAANELPKEIPQTPPPPQSKVQLEKDNPFIRPGNRLPTYLDPKTAPLPFERHSMLYSYANTVESSYTGDFRHYVKKFGAYLTTKATVYDPLKNVFKPFDVKYAAPNLVFSDNMVDPSTGKDNTASIKDRIVLPIISYHLTGTKRDPKRAIDPSVRYSYKDKDGRLITSLSASAPIPLDYSFQVDVWTETREHFYQIITAFQSDFNPYSYLTDLHDYEDETKKTNHIPYAKMVLESWTDNSNYIPGTDRRIVRGTLNITVNGWLTVIPKDIPYYSKLAASIEDTAFTTISPSNTPPGTVIIYPVSGGQQTVPAVSSVFNRDGNVTALPGDYNANQINFQPIADIANADTVQEAIQAVIHEVRTIQLGETITVNTCFRQIGNKAYKVASIGGVTPYVDGVILQDGTLNQYVGAAKDYGIVYESPTLTFIASETLYLGQDGKITTVIPDKLNGDNYLLIVGRTIENTNKFIFSPGITIKLN